MKIKKTLPFVIIPLILLSALGFGIYKRSLDARPTASGILERDRIELPALMAERITEIHVSEGEQIQEGDIILEQDNRRALAAYSSAQAEADRAAASLEKVQNGPRPEEKAQVRALLEGAEALLEQQTDNLNRVREMDRRISTASLNLKLPKPHGSRPWPQEMSLQPGSNFLNWGAEPKTLRWPPPPLPPHRRLRIRPGLIWRTSPSGRPGQVRLIRFPLKREPHRPPV